MGVRGGKQVRPPRAWGIGLMGGLLTAGGVVAIPYHFRGEPLVTLLFYGFMDIFVPLSIVASAIYVARTDLEYREIQRATYWMAGVVVVVAGLYLWSRLGDVLAGSGTRSIFADLALFCGFGAALGLVIGMNRARAAQNARLLERTAAQQDALTFINHLLRHNVLNGLQVVDGYGDLLDQHVDEDGARYLRTIRERADHMADLVGTVRVLMRTLADGIEPVAIDVGRVVEREVAIAREGHPEASFETDLDRDVRALADPMLGAVLENLLTNAVVHHDGPSPEVTVTVERVGREVIVRVADDGPGVAGELRERYLVEGSRGPDSGGTGLGLYLVSTLAEAYGGRFALGANEPRGTVAELRLLDAESVDAAREATLH
ncbi:sensor histidine kinase [Haloglomus litoreum]|uniref:sensor histidine kinase n=1 Tax=Haloglomus litoreum TaxID=3034026 RepID=UPI0023E7A219|nr:HAMP domain-containing sensor histidine kinase [Haloglomus sp. DT116]